MTQYCDWDQTPLKDQKISLKTREMPLLGLECDKYFCCSKCKYEFLNIVRESLQDEVEEEFFEFTRGGGE